MVVHRVWLRGREREFNGGMGLESLRSQEKKKSTLDDLASDFRDRLYAEADSLAGDVANLWNTREHDSYNLPQDLEKGMRRTHDKLVEMLNHAHYLLGEVEAAQEYEHALKVMGRASAKDEIEKLSRLKARVEGYKSKTLAQLDAVMQTRAGHLIVGDALLEDKKRAEERSD